MWSSFSFASGIYNFVLVIYRFVIVIVGVNFFFIIELRFVLGTASQERICQCQAAPDGQRPARSRKEEGPEPRDPAAAERADHPHRAEAAGGHGRPRPGRARRHRRPER